MRHKAAFNMVGLGRKRRTRGEKSQKAGEMREESEEHDGKIQQSSGWWLRMNSTWNGPCKRR